MERDLSISIVEAERAVFVVCVDWRCSTVKPLFGRLEAARSDADLFSGILRGTATGTHLDVTVDIGTGAPAFTTHVSITMKPERSPQVYVVDGEIPWTSDHCNPLPAASTL